MLRFGAKLDRTSTHTAYKVHCRFAHSMHVDVDGENNQVLFIVNSIICYKIGEHILRQIAS